MTEATETKATTQTEAAKGDAQALRKLAAEKAASSAQAAAPSAADPDHDGDPRKLDVKA